MGVPQSIYRPFYQMPGSACLHEGKMRHCDHVVMIVYALTKRYDHDQRSVKHY